MDPGMHTLDAGIPIDDSESRGNQAASQRGWNSHRKPCSRMPFVLWRRSRGRENLVLKSLEARIRRQSHFYLSRYYIISSKVERVNDISIFRIFPPTRFNRVYTIRKKSRSWRRISSEGPPLSPRYRYLFTKQRNLKRGGILYTSHRQTFRPREGSLLPSYGGGGWVTPVRGFEEVSGREKGDVFSGQQQISYD